MGRVDIFRLAEPQRTHQTTETLPLHLCVSFKFGSDFGATKDAVSLVSGRAHSAPAPSLAFLPFWYPTGWTQSNRKQAARPIYLDHLSQRRVAVLLMPEPPQAADTVYSRKAGIHLYTSPQ